MQRHGGMHTAALHLVSSIRSRHEGSGGANGCIACSGDPGPSTGSWVTSGGADGTISPNAMSSLSGPTWPYLPAQHVIKLEHQTTHFTIHHSLASIWCSRSLLLKSQWHTSERSHPKYHATANDPTTKNDNAMTTTTCPLPDDQTSVESNEKENTLL